MLLFYRLCRLEDGAAANRDGWNEETSSVALLSHNAVGIRSSSVLRNACVSWALEFGEDGTPQGGPAESEEPPRGGGDVAGMRLLADGPPAQV